MSTHQENTINKYIFGFFILALGVFLFCGLKEFFSAFLGSIVFYILFKKFMFNLVHKRKFNKTLSAVIIIIISFIIVILPIGIFVGVIYNKAAAFIDNPSLIKVYINQVTAAMDRLPFKAGTKDMPEKIATFITSHMGGVLNQSMNVLASLLMMYFFLYFWLININKTESRLIRFLPFKKQTIDLFSKELVDQTHSNAIGVPVIAVAQGIITYCGYMIVGFPNPGLWGILTGFASILPLVGTAIIWLPISIYLLADGQTWQGIFILAYSAIVVGTADNLIRMVVSKKVGDVHPIITVLGVIIGLKFFGLPGLVFGPLLLSSFVILLKLFKIEYSRETEEKDPETKDEDVSMNPQLMQEVLRRMLTSFYPKK